MTRHGSTLEAPEVRGRTKTWAHLHLPRLQAARTAGLDPRTQDVISVKVPGQKIRYVSGILLRDVVFHVSEAGRQTCLREGVRNVHAWVVGTETAVSVKPSTERRAIYDPWKGGTFVDADTLEPVHTASYAWLVGKDVFYV